MSKISPIQAEALGLKVEIKSAPIMKVNPAKPVAKKAISSKPAAKPAVKKTVAIKPAVIKAASKPATKAKPVATKRVTKIKALKVKMERDSFTMPKEEYAQLTLLKARLMALGQPAKKSELLRAGIKLLVAMSDNTLKATLAKIPVIKTGRPKKK